jgi:hypothetical protein
MHLSNTVIFILATGLTLSTYLGVEGSLLDARHNKNSCDKRPLVKVDTFTTNELDKKTKHWLPRPDKNGTRGVPSFKPKRLPFLPEPNLKPIKDLYFDKLVDLKLNDTSLNNTALFLRKLNLGRRDYPWCTIGKIDAYDRNAKFLKSCTGTVVGRNLMLTASHCVPWNQGNGQWSMDFIPAYNGEDTTNPRPFGTVWITKCRGVRNTDDVTGLDYVICQLTENIGDRVGYMGWHASSGDSFYYSHRWTSVGYPDDSFGGQVPMVEDNIGLDDVDDEGSDGKELESYVFASHGWSGGPLFGILDGQPKVVGVVSGFETEFSFWDFFVKDHTVSAGGMHMASLIAYGRNNWAF